MALPTLTGGKISPSGGDPRTGIGPVPSIRLGDCSIKLASVCQELSALQLARDCLRLFFCSGITLRDRQYKEVTTMAAHRNDLNVRIVRSGGLMMIACGKCSRGRSGRNVRDRYLCAAAGVRDAVPDRLSKAGFLGIAHYHQLRRLPDRYCCALVGRLRPRRT